MMCQTKIVVSPFLARVSIGALAAAAWLIFSLGVPGSFLDEVCAHTANGRFVFGALSACGERAYRTAKSRWRGGADLEPRQSKLRDERLIHFQGRCIACAPRRNSEEQARDWD
jgi:hypothetical protein